MIMTVNMSDNNGEVEEWWSEASFAVANDMRSHTGGIMLLRQGAVYALSARLKINSKSSTEDKHLGVYELMGHVL